MVDLNLGPDDPIAELRGALVEELARGLEYAHTKLQMRLDAGESLIQEQEGVDGRFGADGYDPELIDTFLALQPLLAFVRDQGIEAFTADDAEAIERRIAEIAEEHPELKRTITAVSDSCKRRGQLYTEELVQARIASALATILDKDELPPDTSVELI